jgi:hypothetical protein
MVLGRGRRAKQNDRECIISKYIFAVWEDGITKTLKTLD